MARTRSVTFTDASLKSPTTYDLDFGDGSAHAVALPVTHVYEIDVIGAPYQVTATLTVTTGNYSNSISKTIDLMPGELSGVIELGDGIIETGEGIIS